MRYEVEFDGLTWQVDEYLGALEGLVTADVELEAEDQVFIRPSWVGDDITGNRRFGSAVLAETIQTMTSRRGIDIKASQAHDRSVALVLCQ